MAQGTWLVLIALGVWLLAPRDDPGAAEEDGARPVAEQVPMALTGGVARERPSLVVAPAVSRPLTLGPPGARLGRVVDDRGEPVPAARVQVPGVFSDVRDADSGGWFVVPSEFPQRELLVEHPGHASTRVPAGSANPDEDLVVVLPRLAQLDVDVAEDPRGRVRVVAWQADTATVLDPREDEPPRPVRFDFVPEALQTSLRTIRATREDTPGDPARFELEPGVWQLVALRHGGDLPALRRELSGECDEGMPITRRSVSVRLDAGEVRTLTLPAPPHTWITGRVHDRERGVPGVLISGVGAAVYTDADGRFVIDDPPSGAHELFARRTGDPYVRSADVLVPVDGHVHVELPFEGRALALLVRGARSGEPVADARVRIAPAATRDTWRLPAGQQESASVDRHGFWLARTDAAGRARLTLLPDGAYDVWAEAPGWLPTATITVHVGPSEPGAARRADDEPVALELQRGTPLELTLQDAGTLWSVRLQPELLRGPDVRAGRDAQPAPELLPVDLHRARRGGDGPFLAQALRPGLWSLQIDGLLGARRWPVQIPDLAGEAYVLVLDASP